MTKRNPFEAMNSTFASPSSAPESVVAMIPTAIQKKRDAKSTEQIEKRRASRRTFDQQNPCFGYFIPEHLHGEAKSLRAAILGLAQNRDRNINVTEINMTTSLVSWALGQVRKGNLSIKGTPDARRRKMTVIIEDVADTWEKTPLEIEPFEKKVRAKRIVFTYRFPREIDQQISKLAGNFLPKGEVLIRLLQHAVQAVRNGDTKIIPTPKEMRQEATIVDVKKAGDTW